MLVTSVPVHAALTGKPHQTKGAQIQCRFRLDRCSAALTPGAAHDRLRLPAILPFKLLYSIITNGYVHTKPPDHYWKPYRLLDFISVILLLPRTISNSRDDFFFVQNS